ncbi:MAG: transporter substrate-binding domain-containing protein [Pseudomonadales bacterium]|nr:transporter substrate-binding domain-containing protein [Pseudomonadales bacterium]NRA14498.1 transporter substrate-binding domain-containing protein [Oceanospirillaceae bacterium]
MRSKLIYCLLTLLFSHYLAAKPPLSIILATHNLCPYGCFKDNRHTDNTTASNFSGVATDVVRCSLKSMGIPLRITVLPWKRAESAVITGAVDGFFAASQNEVRDSFALMSGIIAEQKWQWFILKNNSLAPNRAGFKKKATVAGFIGSNMLYWLEKNNFNVTSRPVDTEGLYKLLIRKRVDAVIANNYVMDKILTDAAARQKIKVFTIKDKPLGVYFSHPFIAKHPSFIDAFNKNVALCRR